MRFVMETTKVQDISAVTLAVRDMARAVKFYRKLGFEPVLRWGQRQVQQLTSRLGPDQSGSPVRLPWQPVGPGDLPGG